MNKLILTEYNHHSLALLMDERSLLQVYAVPPTPSQVGAIHLGKIKNIVRNIDACFVEIEEKQLVYLPLSLCKHAYIVNRVPDGRVLEGDELPVQIIRDAQKTKQASVTTQLTLSGRFFVFNAGSSHVGISSKLSPSDSARLQDFLKEHEIVDAKMRLVMSGDPVTFGMVVRTEAAGASEEELLREFRSLSEQFVRIFHNARYSTCFKCLHPAKSNWDGILDNIPVRDYEEAVTDSSSVYEEVSGYFSSRGKALRLYQDPSYPLSKLYCIRTRLEEAFSRRIWLKSGAYLVFDTTEALSVFDVNSGKFESKNPSAETFRQINLEAAAEIVRQIRLRNLSGIILIDFINLSDPAMEQELLEYVRQLVRSDRIPTRAVDITPLGLMEITRKKINKPLAESLNIKELFG